MTRIRRLRASLPLLVLSLLTLAKAGFKVSGSFERLPKEDLLLDETKSGRAVGLALAGMTGGGTTALGGN